MTARDREGVVVFRRTGSPADIDAIDQYCRHLVDALAEIDAGARYEPRGLRPVLGSWPAPGWVLLQYNAFRYGRWGFAPWLVPEAWRLRQRGVRLGIMIHEAWVGGRDWRSMAMGFWQRAQLRTLARLASAIMTSTEALAKAIGRGALHVPVASNIRPLAISRAVAHERLRLGGRTVIALFGRDHETRALSYADVAIAATASVLGPGRLAVLNLGTDAPVPSIPAGVELRSPGRLPADDLSLHLRASDLVLLPLTDGVSTRRSTLMAALAHGRPVVGLRGLNTDSVLADASDALVLTPMGDPSAFADAAVTLASDCKRRRLVAGAGRRLYTDRFDWPVLAGTVASMFVPAVPSPASVTAAT